MRAEPVGVSIRNIALEELIPHSDDFNGVQNAYPLSVGSGAVSIAQVSFPLGVIPLPEHQIP